MRLGKRGEARAGVWEGGAGQRGAAGARGGAARLERVGVERLSFLAGLPLELGARGEAVAEQVDAVDVEAQAGLRRGGPVGEAGVKNS